MSHTSNTPGEFFINHLFLSTLQELAQQANFQLNRKKAYAYTRAANSIRDHKLPLKSAEDARKLSFIGPKISQQLDFVLQKYYRDQGKKDNVLPKSGKEMVAWFLQGMGEEYTTLYSKLMLDKGYDNELILSNLTDEDLNDIGVTLPGHRRTIKLKSQEMKHKGDSTGSNNNTNNINHNGSAIPMPNTALSPRTEHVTESRVAEQIIEQTLQLYPRNSLLAELGISVHTNMGQQHSAQSKGLKVFQTARRGRLPAHLDSSFIEKNCSEPNFINGHTLFKEDKVVLIVLNGDEMYGEIQVGDQLYHVIATLSNSRVTKAICDCSYTKQGWCKHIAALLLAALECLVQSRETGESCVQVSADNHVIVPSASDIFAMKNKLAQQREQRRQSVTRVSGESDESQDEVTDVAAEIDSSDIDSADLEEIDSAFHVGPVTPVKQRIASASKMYIPRYRSGAWAILLSMLTAAREEGESDDTCQTLMSKDEIVMRARPLSNASFEAEQVFDLANKSTEELEREITCPGGYTAWSAMTKLRSRGLVEVKVVNGTHMFRLTKLGKDLAKKLFIAAQQLDEDPREIATPKRARDASTDDRSPKRRRVDTCQTGASNNINVNNSDVINVEGPDPTTVQSPLKMTPVKHATQPKTDVRTILSSPHARVVLLIDNRELNRDTTRSLKDKLAELGVVCISRNLELGDMMWVVTDVPALVDGAHEPELDTRQVVLNVIVERKTIGDLRASLADGRYKEQKFRLKKSGIRRVLYVIEGALEDETFRPLLNAIQCSMSVHESIEPVRTKGEEDTAIYLSHVTQYLTRQLDEYRASDASEVPAWSSAVTLAEWWHSASKSKHLTLRDVFAKQLLVLKQLTPHRAAAIVQQYPTPRALIEAYNALEIDQRGRDELLQDVRAGSDQKRIGLAVSQRVSLFYNHIGDNLSL